MSKQIKISDDLYKRLKDLADQDYRTIGGQIEFLLDKSMGIVNVLGEKKAFTAPPEKIGTLKPAAPLVGVNELINLPNPEDIKQSNAELDCCQHPTRPCKHWVWDTASGEGYRNTLSGRYREAE